MPSLLRVRTMPWLMVLELAMLLRRHWRLLEPHDRARLAALVRKSQGRPNRLTADERNEVRRLVAKLEPGQIARGMMPIGRRAAVHRRRRL